MVKPTFRRPPPSLGHPGVPSLQAALAKTARHPDDAKAWRDLGQQYLLEANALKAREALTTATGLNAGDAISWTLLGQACAKLADHTSALQYYTQALKHDENSTIALYGLIESNFSLGKHEPTLAYAEKLLTLQPRHIGGLLRQSQSLFKLHRFDEALRVAQWLVENDARNRSLHLNELGNMWRDLAELENAQASYEQAAKLTDTDPVPLSNQITMAHYLPHSTPEEILALCREWGQKFAPRTKTPRRQASDRTPGRPLRVGMVSDGFRRHPVGYMITPALESVGAWGIKLFFYTSSNVVDPITQQLMRIATKWTDIARLSDTELADFIRNDSIDILIDLSGHNAGTRMRTIAMEPAPVIVKWVGGLINTTGVESIDYLISDGVESPPGSDAFYTEKLIRMPDDYICYQPPPHMPEVGPLPAATNGYVTFGCFNNPTKVNEVLLAEWARLLLAVPDSRLFLKGTAFGFETMQQRVVRVMATHGIDASRIRFEGHSNHVKLLESYNEIDIALDPWPYSGGLTTCEAMMMGVPVITLPGPTFAGRHSATHLVNAGMPELVTQDWDEYIARAKGLAGDLQSLSIIRNHLRRILLDSPVCNSAKYAGHLADALRAIWQRYCEGKTPAALGFTEQGLPQFEGDAAPTLVSHPDVSADDSPNAECFAFSFEGKIVVLDHGAALSGHPHFARMADLGAFSTIAIDPASKLTSAAELQSQGHLQHYHGHYALGSGSSADLYVCLDTERSGTLPPLSPERQPAFARQPSNVIAKLPLPCTRLDDIDGLARVDWLWLDDANDNLGILQGASRLLDSMLILQVGIRFVETYERQPRLHEVEAMLKQYGFRLLRLNNLRHHNYLPVSEGESTIDGAQLLSADAVFVPDESRLDKLDTNQHLKLAFLLHTIYQTTDLAYEVLGRIDAAEAQRYLASHQALECLQLAAQPAQLTPPAAYAIHKQHVPLNGPVRKGAHPPSADDITRLAATISATPHMEPEGRALLAERLGKSKIFLEYGSGGSSVMAAQSNIRKIYSIDSDETYLRAVQARIGQLGGDLEKYLPIYADIGPTGDWGRPRDYGSAALWPAYANEPWNVMEKQGASPDLILVDGRFRVACFLISALLADEGCVILFDDYFDRPGYHVVEKYLKPVRAAGRMAEFVVPAIKPHGLVQELLRYCTKPD